MKLVEVHIIQNLAPSNLNRDDTGSPKDALFGGVRRARVSSQSQKRAVRLYFQDGLSPLRAEEQAVRTKRLVDKLVELETGYGRPADEARQVIKAALGGLGLEIGQEDRTEYLLFLGHREIQRLAELIHQNWDALLAVAQAGQAGGQGEQRQTRRRERKKAARAAVPDEVRKALRSSLDGGRAVDVALFGRMLADEPEWRVDAAAQVAHGLSTHRVDREFDFYTAVDDLNPKEETGAGMMGDVEFYSACLYRYANVNLERLVANLQGDKELAAKGVEAFLRGFAVTLPSGKQNSFAAHNPPGFAAYLVRDGASPRNLAGAFEVPVRLRGTADEKSVSGLSVEALLRTWMAFDRAFGRPQAEWVSLLNLTDGEVSFHEDKLVPSLDAAVDGAMKGVRALLGVS